jgi:hypothetical protein
MTVRVDAHRLLSGRLTLPLVLFALLVGCCAIAAVVVAADLAAISEGRRASETRTGPLVAAVEKTIQEPRRTVATPPVDEGGPGAAEARRRATLMMMLNGDREWGDLLLRR